MNLFIPIFFTFILGVVYFPVSAAQMYKWVDEEGNVQFSQIPPKDKKNVETIKNRFPVEASTAKQAEETHSTENETPSTAEEEEDPVAASCKRAKKHVKLLNSGQDLVIKDDSGKFQQMTPERIQQEMTEAQNYIKEYCQDKPQDSMTE